ncbi:hypothetical protein Y032_0093g2640 [Ancylostoma ceylanicum]|uniref:Uncharacterized protein n=1 Tax=Ancylostoma ceylanicum TaxID=53326 RepID=A0A016TLG9_9BILA|nr:hypothetical protein Y032_0093g2640 [Ancylostoma ceylanicum]
MWRGGGLTSASALHHADDPEALTPRLPCSDAGRRRSARRRGRLVFSLHRCDRSVVSHLRRRSIHKHCSSCIINCHLLLSLFHSALDTRLHGLRLRLHDLSPHLRPTIGDSLGSERISVGLRNIRDLNKEITCFVAPPPNWQGGHSFVPLC